MDHSPSFFQSKIFKNILYALVTAIVLLLTFEAGVYMGYQKAMFSSKWAQNYLANFFPRSELHFTPFLNQDGLVNDHGALGDIIKIDGSSIVVKGTQEPEKTILIQNNTVIERGTDTLKFSDLAAGNHVIVFGSPNDSGQIQAKLIRILPLNSFLH